MAVSNHLTSLTLEDFLMKKIQSSHGTVALHHTVAHLRRWSFRLGLLTVDALDAKSVCSAPIEGAYPKGKRGQIGEEKIA